MDGEIVFWEGRSMVGTPFTSVGGPAEFACLLLGRALVVLCCGVRVSLFLGGIVTCLAWSSPSLLALLNGEEKAGDVYDGS